MTKNWVHGLCHSPVCQILLQIVVTAVITSSPPAWISSAGVLSTPADFPFFTDCTAASIFLRRICVCLGTVQYWWISIGLVIVRISIVFCPSVQYLSFFCEAFSWTILDSSSIFLFHSGQVFHELVCPLTVVLPQIFFNLTTLFSFPVLFCLFHAPLGVVVHFLVFLRSLRFKSFRSQFSPFVAQIKNFCSDPEFFSSDDVCQGSHWLFQSILCWRWWSWNPGLCLRCP